MSLQEDRKRYSKQPLDWFVKARKKMGLPLNGSNLSTPEEASKFVQILVSAYPPYQRQGDHEVYVKMLADACTGVPLPILREMVRPKVGLLGKSRWLPSVSEVVDWIEGYQRKFKVTAGEPLTPVHEEKFYDRNGKLIPGKKFTEPVTKEEREAHADRLNALSAAIRGATKAAQAPFKAVTVQDSCTKEERDKMLMDSLHNLEMHREENAQNG
jgi:hypothetical protein